VLFRSHAEETAAHHHTWPAAGWCHFAQAHHGWSFYDADQLLSLEVPLQTVNYRNPHADVSIEHDGRT